MANVIEGIRYTKDHEWIKLESDHAISGITDYAQSELSDIVMVEPPAIGRKIKPGDVVGVIEAVKAVSDLYAAMTGEVLEINKRVVTDPSIINKDPYNEGWLYKIKITDAKEYDKLLSPDQYKELISKH